MSEHPTGPVYRFHGHVAPSRAVPVSAMADIVDAVEGVATMRLYDPIDSWGGEWGVSAKEFAKALDTLPDDTSEIRLHINSPGGEVYEGLAILNQLRNHKARTVAVVDGLAASAASFIAAGADEVIMGRNSQLMIHDAWGLCVGASVDMRDMADRLDKISDNIASVYAARAPEGDWRAAMLAETWFDAHEAVTAGLADSVEAGPTADAKNSFDLSIFQHAGREAAPEPTIYRATCHCGPNGVPAVADAEHKDECPDAPAEQSIEQPAASFAEWAKRKHRMTARAHGFPLPQ